MITIVDTGGSNIASIGNAIRRLGEDFKLTSSRLEIKKATHVILPGVGAAKDSMDRLRKSDLVEVIKELKVPTLGICLGMQLLFKSSSEGDVDCLGIIDEKVTKFKTKKGFPVPHMGWNRIVASEQCPLLKDVELNSYFYFVHSFFAPVGKYTKAYSVYSRDISAVIQKDNFFGTQFHPEKSTIQGQRILRNFIKL